jgi:transcription elongation GreA/GreB family factor
MDKQQVIEAVIEELHRELQVYLKAAQAAHAEATHEQSKPENKYDTRGLEASYLARGQSRQAAEIINAIKQFQALSLTKWKAEDPIDVGALVELKEKAGGRGFYFIGPAGGGTEVRVAKKHILVITPASPLGQQLLEHKTGDKVELLIAGAKSEYLIVAVS